MRHHRPQGDLNLAPISKLFFLNSVDANSDFTEYKCRIVPVIPASNLSKVSKHVVTKTSECPLVCLQHRRLFIEIFKYQLWRKKLIRDRFHLHVNAEALQLLDNQHHTRRSKRILTSCNVLRKETSKYCCLHSSKLKNNTTYLLSTFTNNTGPTSVGWTAMRWKSISCLLKLVLMGS